MEANEHSLRGEIKRYFDTVEICYRLALLRRVCTSTHSVFSSKPWTVSRVVNTLCSVLKSNDRPSAFRSSSLNPKNLCSILGRSRNLSATAKGSALPSDCSISLTLWGGGEKGR